MEDDFLNQGNLEYLESLYALYQTSPTDLDPRTRSFMQGLAFPTALAACSGASHASQARESTSNQAVEAYRTWGHLSAKLDPLGQPRKPNTLLPEAASQPQLEQLYTGTLAIEYPPATLGEERAWLIQEFESPRAEEGPEDKKAILTRLFQAEDLEHFLQARFLGQKRFSVEGAEALIPLLDSIVETSAPFGTEEFLIGMAHRGRLNVLANVVGKPLELLLAEFSGKAHFPAEEGEGDVKYHMGYSADRPLKDGKIVHFSLKPNPSHLELVDPVLEGATKAVQDLLGGRDKALPVLVHGEAAFVGQGVVAETLVLSQLDGFNTGGTIHIVINNQVGFTANAGETRATEYPTAIAQAFGAPVLHVNGDDVLEVARAGRLSSLYRQRFHKDVFIDLWCYRKHGHNESDDPTFTQPLLYKKIAAQPSVATLFSQALIREQILTEESLAELKNAVRRDLDKAWEKAQQYPAEIGPEPPGGRWTALKPAREITESPKTQVSEKTLKQVGESLTTVRQSFHLHPKLSRFVAARREMLGGNRPLDWSTGEALSFGTLLLDGYSIRLVGQDAQRGTFTQRHSVWINTENGTPYLPLTQLVAGPRPSIHIYNSMLSELAAVGFEYGYSSADPSTLVLWEAQFGDFVNGAQPVLDQFMAAAESKWRRMNGLVLLLPHGYEGQGAEHSSSRLERFLQLCGRGNIQVCYPSTPSQYFHLLRRQMLFSFRKPLVVMTPKSLLRHKLCVSSLTDFTQGGFGRILVDQISTKRKLDQILLCTGKVYYSILDCLGNGAGNVPTTAIIRVEQLYPFPLDDLAEALSRLGAVARIAWVQEEPKNMGAWTFVETRLRDKLPGGAKLQFLGRPEAASPAVGWYGHHEAEEAELLESVRTIEPPSNCKSRGSRSPEPQEEGRKQYGRR